MKSRSTSDFDRGPISSQCSDAKRGILRHAGGVAAFNLDSGEAVVDEEMRAIDEHRLVASEIERGACHVLGFADPSLLGGNSRVRHIDAECLQFADLAQSVRRADEAGADGVAAD